MIKKQFPDIYRYLPQRAKVVYSVYYIISSHCWDIDFYDSFCSARKIGYRNNLIHIHKAKDIFFQTRQ